MKTKILLFIIILLGLAFRIYGINFDQTCCQHPDERAIVMFTLPLQIPNSIESFLSPNSPLNPHFFAYGNLPLYLLKAASLAAGVLDPQFLSYDKINLVGRLISIAAEIVTIFIIFLLAKTLANTRVGLIAAFVYSISVLPIQYSHFFTSDILLTMFITLTLFRIVKFYQSPSIKNAIFVGIIFGLSLATKISALPLIVAISFALAADFIFIFIQTPHKVRNWLPHIPRFLKKLITEGLVILISTVATFVIAQPYALIDFAEFIKQNLQQSQMTHNAYIFPYTLQYVGKIPYIYELKNIFFWGLGPVIALFFLGGLFFTLKSIQKESVSKRTEILIILIFLISFFAVVGNFSVGFMRYLLPLYPIFAIFAGICLYHMFDFIKNKYSLNLLYVKAAAVFLLLLIWPLTFVNVYSKTNTRIEASDWIRQNIPKGSTLAVEHWDDRLPMSDSSGYNFQELALYEVPDNEFKWNKINNQLDLSDYIIIASNRLYIPLQKLNDCKKFEKCYPKTSSYYKDLFSDKLRFKFFKEFSSYPTVPIVGLKIIDDSADESFTVYDHPKIFIYKRK